LAKITKASYSVLVACTIAHVMNHIYTGALAPFLPIISEELGLSWTEAGFITSAVIVTMTAAHLLIGYLGDKKGWRDIFISVSVLAAAVVMLFASFATSFLYLIATQIAMGFAVSGYHPSAFPAITDAFPKRERAKAVGIQAMGGLIGMALIPVVGVWLLVVMGGWRESLQILAVLGVIVFIPSFSLMRHSNSQFKQNENNNENTEGDVDGWTRNYFLVLILMGLRGIPFRSTTLLMPLYLVDQYGFEPIWAGSLTSIMLVSGLFAEIISAPLSDRTGKRVPFMILSAGLAGPILLMLNFSLEVIPLVLVLMAFGFIYFLGVPPAQAYQTEVAPKKAKGLAFGIFFSIGAIPGALAPFIFGVLAENYGLESSIMFLVIVSVLATIVALFLKEVPETETVTVRVPE